jgi:mediator of RNA polymerase II transcription subunit 31
VQFIQCLASPNYLHELAIQGYLEDPAFLNFLEYLEYWRAPEFAQHIVSVPLFTVPALY